jgi:SAM-dependent methyltransferase
VSIPEPHEHVGGRSANQIVWHDLECGRYRADLALWSTLAAGHGDPVLEVGAGTGRVTLELARAGHRVTALDSDPVVLGELARRARGLAVQTVAADARRFEVPTRFAVCIVPMQTIQLLGGARGRIEFLARARAHLRDDGILAIAIAEELEPYDVTDERCAPTPDTTVLDGLLYSSQALAIRAEQDGFVLERRRTISYPGGDRTQQHDLIRLDRLEAAQLEHEGRAGGLTPVGREIIPETSDHAGSTVVILGV